MSYNTKIEWTDGSWNPTRGCTPISPGCLRCYAKIFAERFRGVPGHPYEQGFDLRLVPEKLGEPLLWKRPRRIFVNSMSDLFHRDIPDDFIEQVAAVMAEANHHIYQILTKRHERMATMLQGRLVPYRGFKHIWWGVSVEDREYGLPRIEALRQAKPEVAFLSVEPLLEDLGEVNLEGIDWVIAGGESGPRARLVQQKWIQKIRDQCLDQKVPFFFKQWGGTRKHLTGRELDGRTWDEFPSLDGFYDAFLKTTRTPIKNGTKGS